MLGSDVATRMMVGENGIHIPLRMIVQKADEGVVSFVGAIRDTKIKYGSKMIHQFVWGDCFFRPHVVLETNHLEGVGLAGLVTSSAFCDIDVWTQNGNVLLDPLDIVRKRKWDTQFPMPNVGS